MVHLISSGKEEMEVDSEKEEKALIKEDDVDIELSKEDGWISKERKKSYKMTIDDLPTPPWEFNKIEPWKSEGIKFIPFHAYIRKMKDQTITKGLSNLSSSKTIDLDQPNYRIRTPDSKHEAAWKGTCAIDSQIYRHVDHVEFESPEILEAIIRYWRESGNQRCGFLYGKYIKDEHIPLGIRASVSAIYEPPQKNSKGIVSLEKDPNIEHVDQFASLFGLKKIGFLWTDIQVDQTKRIIQNRVEYVLTSSEIIQMAKMQNAFPSPCKEASSGFCGSKFVSVLITGDATGQIDVNAFQVSDQCMSLVRDGVITFSKDPKLLRIKKSSKRIIPDVIYRTKNEYGVEVLTKADPTFPPEFFIIRLGQGAPKTPNPLFKTIKFPIENRNLLQDLNAVKRQVSNLSLPLALSDFHLLLFLSFKIDQNDMKQIADFVLKRTNERMVRSLLEKILGGISQNDNQSGPTISPEGQKLVDQLVQMGYSPEDALSAVWATGENSIQLAVEFLEFSLPLNKK